MSPLRTELEVTKLHSATIGLFPKSGLVKGRRGMQFRILNVGAHGEQIFHEAFDLFFDGCCVLR